ncbi:hypothetical protein NZNM25_05440 [Nitrosopumilus zosterae]|uniref:Uncharacterized protein n=1 Tax=Nitrosopumilus zosterae TaxID=718286 RepID=A0A2S2KQ16_9ARCH|nr:hypothetical protein NZNM25_05440 [Nitrosopumilus zosterae]
MTKLVFCMDCGECLGEDRPNHAKHHLKKHPNHRKYLTIPIIDPLLLPNPDEWFRKHENRLSQRFYGQPKSNTEKTTDDETEPDLTPENQKFSLKSSDFGKRHRGFV